MCEQLSNRHVFSKSEFFSERLSVYFPLYFDLEIRTRTFRGSHVTFHKSNIEVSWKWTKSLCISVAAVYALFQKLGQAPFFSFFLLLRLLLFIHFGETPMADILFPPIFWHNQKGGKRTFAHFSAFYGQRSVSAVWATRSPGRISSYATIWGETKFQTREIPRSG